MNNVKQDGRDLGLIQRWMQTVIMNPAGVANGIASAEAQRLLEIGPDEAESVVTRSPAMTAVERLAIYGYAYYARLLECLREEFPVLKNALGEELFDSFAAEYLERYPSRTYTLFQLGAHFPHFLAETRPDKDGDGEVAPSWPDFLIDLATLEQSFNEVFDGPGVEGQQLLDAAQLRKISPERLLTGRLEGVSSLRLLSLRYPVHKYFTAVRRHESPELPDPTDTFLAVTRRSFVVRHYELSPPAHKLLSALLAGTSVGGAIQQAFEIAGSDLARFPDDLGAWFHDWAAEGFFRAVVLIE